MPLEAAAQFALHVRADLGDMAADVGLVIDLQRLDGDGRRDRVARVGEAGAERADLVAFVGERLEHPLVDHHGADRQIRGREGLRADQDVRLQAHRLAAPVVAGAPEAADHLVGDEQHVVFLQHRLDLFVVGARRHDHAAGAEHGLRPHRRNRVRPLGEDQLFQFLGAAGREGFLGLAGLGQVVVMRRHRVDEAGQRHVEAAMVGRQPGEARGRQRDAVIALHPPDQLLLRCPAERVVEIPDHLDGRVVRLGARIREEHLAHRHRRAGDQHFRELDHRLVRFRRERVIERQRPHLPDRRLDQPLVGKAEGGAPESGERVDVFAAGIVPDMAALAPADDERPRFQMRAEVGIGMQGNRDIARGVGVGAGRGHGGASFTGDI
jgi:hypothetical protein